MSTLTAARPLLSSDEARQAAWEGRWITALLILGVIARTVRYILRFPLWEDECFLAYGIIVRDFAQLAGPLEFHQVSPLLFLWMQKAVTELLGVSELSLRLMPFVCSLASLALFTRVARRLLSGKALLLAVGLFAVSYPGIRYAAEAKPYGLDAAVSLAVLALAVEWWASGRTRWLWVLAAMTPVFVLLSYPALFVCGACSAVVAVLLRRRADRAALAAWLVMNALLLAAFALTLLLARSAYVESSEFQVSAYARYFLPWNEPQRASLWLLKMFTGEALAFPVGSGNGGSSVTLLLVVIGVHVLWRTGRGALATALVLTLALHLTASALRRYPFGGHVKFSMYLMPLICLAAGAGGAAIIDAFWSARLARRVTAAALIVLALFAAGSAVRDVLHPYKTRSDERARSFARWLWFDLPHEGEVACLKEDLGQTFAPATFRDLSWSAMYLVNRHIVSPPAGPVEWRHLRPDWPLYIAEYRDAGHPYDHAAQQQWLARMQGQYRLVSLQAYPITRYDKRERRLIKIDHVFVYKFIPR